MRDRPVHEWRSAVRGAFPEQAGEIFNALSGVFESGPKKWHQQPFVFGLPRVQDYIDGDVGAIVEFEWTGGLGSEGVMSLGGETGKCGFAFKLECYPFGRSECRVTGGSSLRHDEQHVVFIPIVELADEPQCIVASFVGLKRFEKKALDAWEGVLHRSLLDGRFYVVDTAPWEGKFVILPDGSFKTHPTTVESRPQAEDNVSGQQAYDRVDKRVLDEGNSFLRVVSGPSGFQVFCDKHVNGSLKVTDLLLGPSDLEARV